MSKNIPSIEGLKKSEALTVLIQSGLDFEEANNYWKDNRPTATGFVGAFYAELKKGAMSEKDFDAILETGSDNTRKHRSHYNAIRELTNTIHANK